MAVAWLFNSAVSLLLIALSSALCVGWAPEAIGSGIPEVMAYLNGCMVPKVRRGGRGGATSMDAWFQRLAFGGCVGPGLTSAHRGRDE